MCSRSSRQTSGGSTNFQQNMLDAGHRMVPTHATKAGMRYRYYASLPHLKGESKTTSVGSISRIPATDIEAIVVKSAKEHLGVQHGQSSASSTRQTCSMRQVNNNDLARIPCTGTRASRGPRSVASWDWCRAAPSRAAGME